MRQNHLLTKSGVTSFFVLGLQYVGDGVLDIPTAERRQCGIRENLPIEVKFSRRVVEDADPYSQL